MNIYLIWQTVNRGYDTYDSVVVCAESEEDAKTIYPTMVIRIGILMVVGVLKKM